MLVLKRKVNESIVIITKNKEKIEIKISEIQDSKVKLGIEAKKNISIFRKEVLEENKKENKEASLKGKIDKNKLENLLKK